MHQGDTHTTSLLRAMKEKGDLASQINQDTVRELVNTPPSNSLRTQSTSEMEKAAKWARQQAADQKDTAGLENLSTQELVAQLEQDSDVFSVALVDNTRLAKEQMQRSLLQLFEDTAREKLLDPNVVQRRRDGNTVSGRPPNSPTSPLPSTRALASPLAGVVRPSRRPTDRGLDKRDHPSDVVIPDHVREAIGSDIYTVVDHELKRYSSVITSDLSRILDQVIVVRDRMSKLEEDLMQHGVEARMQADQLTSSAALIVSLQDQVSTLQDHNTSKDAQMDLLRDQVARRNQSLDETRVKFRKEVMRYKNRVYDLEMELDTTSTRSRPRRVSMSEALGDDEGNSELLAVAESAVKDVTEKFQEEIRQLNVKNAREKKIFAAEMNMKLAERDGEILRLRQRIEEMKKDRAE